MGAALVAMSVLGVGPLARPGSASPALASPRLALAAPSPVVSPGQAYPLDLAVSRASDDGALALTVTVYDALPDRSHFEETLDGTPVGDVLDPPVTVPLASLSASAPGQYRLAVPVAADGLTPKRTGPFTFDLDCAVGSCGGVYPVQLELSQTTSGAVVARLLTYLVYSDAPSDTEPLRFAWVVPLSLTGVGSPATSPSPRTTARGSWFAATGRLEAISEAIADHPGVALTLAPSPQSVVALLDTGPHAVPVIARVQDAAAGPERQVVCGPYVPVDPAALSRAGLSGELDAQIARGRQVLAQAYLSDCAGALAWVDAGGLDGASASRLAALGYEDAVVSPDTVAPQPQGELTPTRPFDAVGGRNATLHAMTMDKGLSALVDSQATANAALAAERVLAELAQIYDEAPNVGATRGVVAVTPPGSDLAPAFVADLLGVLGAPGSQRIVRPVTVSQLLLQVPAGGVVGPDTWSTTRRLTGTSPPAAPLPGARVRADRAQLQAFASAVSQPALLGALDDQLLVAESSQLGRTGRRAALQRFETDLNGQIHRLSIPPDTVRLTARAATVPVTVQKSAPYPVRAVFTVASDKLVFPPAGARSPAAACRAPVVHSSALRSSFSCTVTITHATTAVYVDMRARASGDFHMEVTLTSPAGNLVLASSQLTVRSISTSAVAIGLTVGAGVVLLGWWAQTWRRRRRRRRGAHLPTTRRPSGGPAASSSNPEDTHDAGRAGDVEAAPSLPDVARVPGDLPQ